MKGTQLLSIAAIMVFLVGGGVVACQPSGAGTAKAESASCSHTLTVQRCPFCSPSLIEEKGFCHGHGVPEAFCHLCDPSVIPAFKAKGDWCAEHDAPESLCPVCAPGAGLKYLEGGAAQTEAASSAAHAAGHSDDEPHEMQRSSAEPVDATVADAETCPHTVAREACPFCTPRLLVDLGFCRGHNVPEALCALCDPDVIPALKAAGDWCEEHKRSATFCWECKPTTDEGSGDVTCDHEMKRADCPFCTPELIVTKGFCEGHGVPEAFCHLCDPDVVPAFKARGDWCAEHEAPESLCPVCSPAFKPAAEPESQGPNQQTDPEIDILRSAQGEPQNRWSPVECDTESMRVRLAPGIGDRIGLETVSVSPRPLRESRTFTAQTDYNRNHLAALAPRAPGVVERVEKESGDTVKSGETLAVIDSAEVGNAKAALLEAAALVEIRQKNFDREVRLLERGIATEQDHLAAEGALAEARIALARARQTLRNFGFHEYTIDRIAEAKDTNSHLELRAPFYGVVIERNATIGEVVGTESPLFRVADPTTLWAWIDVYGGDLGQIAEDRPVLFTPNGLPGERFPGRIRWVSTEIDPRTRTLRARAELANPNGRLRANMFGQAEVLVREAESALVIPKDSVQWEGCCHVVFVKQSDMLYVPKKVRLGHETPEHYEITAGLTGGEEIVTAGSFLLKTEIMKTSIGIGCCELNPAAESR